MKDLHTLKAMELFDVTEEDVTLEQRGYAKFYNYLSMYSAGPRRMLDHYKALCPCGHAKPLK